MGLPVAGGKADAFAVFIEIRSWGATSHVRLMCYSFSLVRFDHTPLSLPEISARMIDLQEARLNQAYRSADYNTIAVELLWLQEVKDQPEKENAENRSRLIHFEGICHYIESQSARVEEFDEAMVHRLIKQISVYGDRFVVAAKCGAEVTVEG